MGGPEGFRDGELTLAEAQAAVQQMTNGYWNTQIIYTAAKLGIADLLLDGPQDVETLADATETHAPSLYRLLRTLAGLGLVSEQHNGQFAITILGRCLARGTPGALRARAILNGEEWYGAWGGLLESVRTGETAFDRVIGRPFFAYLAGNPQPAAVFNEAMASSTQAASTAVAGVYDFSGATTVVDVGGGAGAFLAGILQANPHLRGVLFDVQNIAPAAEALLSSAGVSDRCEVVAGDFFQAVPRNGDIYILSWVIHDWDDERSITILKNCRRAMADTARLLLIEQVIPPGDGASFAKLYDLHMLVLSGGRERTENEYRALLAAADLDLVRVIPTDVPRSVIEALPR